MIDKRLVKRLAISNLVKTTGIYTIAKVINASIPFLLLPILTSYLSPTDYGIISMITTTVAFVTPFVTLNMDSAIVRRYYYKEGSIAKYIGTCLEIVFIICLLVSLLFAMFGDILGHLVSLPNYVVWLIPIYCVFQFLKTVVLYNWQVKDQAIKFGVFSIIATLLEVSIAIFLIVGLGYDWKGRAISLMSSSFILSVFAILYLKRKKMLSLSYTKEYSRHATKYGLGLIPHALGASMMVLANNFFITNMVSVEETGLYGVASSLSGLLSFITLSFNNAYVPWLFKNLSIGNTGIKRKVVKITYLYLAFIFIVGVLSYFFIVLIFPVFVNESFSEASKYIPWLLLGLVFQGGYFMMTNYILYSEKTFYNGIVTISTGLINLGLNYLLILRFGAIGAAIAFSVTYLIYFILTWIVANKVYPMPWAIFHSKNIK